MPLPNEQLGPRLALLSSLMREFMAIAAKRRPQQLALIPFAVSTMSSGLAIYESDWETAYLTALVGVSTTFLFVVSAWIFVAIQKRAPWHDCPRPIEPAKSSAPTPP